MKRLAEAATQTTDEEPNTKNIGCQTEPEADTTKELEQNGEEANQETKPED